MKVQAPGIPLSFQLIASPKDNGVRRGRQAQARAEPWIESSGWEKVEADGEEEQEEEEEEEEGEGSG